MRSVLCGMFSSIGVNGGPQLAEVSGQQSPVARVFGA
jgi:hypothetical protein